MASLQLDVERWWQKLLLLFILEVSVSYHLTVKTEIRILQAQLSLQQLLSGYEFTSAYLPWRILFSYRFYKGLILNYKIVFLLLFKC